jgi:hypothetical protein|tara:strand:- start:228 stop:386 length:159 start_codon:yes stop_codon:yes gene_type:complete
MCLIQPMQQPQPDVEKTSTDSPVADATDDIMSKPAAAVASVFPKLRILLSLI